MCSLELPRVIADGASTARCPGADSGCGAPLGAPPVVQGLTCYAAVAIREVTGGYFQGSRRLWEKDVGCAAPVKGEHRSPLVLPPRTHAPARPPSCHGSSTSFQCLDVGSFPGLQLSRVSPTDPWRRIRRAAHRHRPEHPVADGGWVAPPEHAARPDAAPPLAAVPGTVAFPSTGPCPVPGCRCRSVTYGEGVSRIGSDERRRAALPRSPARTVSTRAPSPSPRFAGAVTRTFRGSSHAALTS